MDKKEALAELQALEGMSGRTDQISALEERLLLLVDRLTPALAVALGDQITHAADGLFPRRRRRVIERLTQASHVEPFSTTVVVEIRQYLREGFAGLSDRHIFQWSTFYRDFVTTLFSRLLPLNYTSEGLADICTTVRDEYARHGAEIFTKGFEHGTRSGTAATQYLTTKSLNGLQRFLELPIDLYSSHVSRARLSGRARVLRRTTSAMLSGILLGYSQARLGQQLGAAILPRFPRSWAHYMAFLTARDLENTLVSLEPGDFRDGSLTTVLPFVEVLDEAASSVRDDQFTLPRLGQFSWDQRRLDVSLAPPLSSSTEVAIEAQCYIDGAFVTKLSLEEAANRGVRLILAPVRPDLLEWAESHDLLRTSVVNCGSDTRRAGVTVTQRTRQLMQFALSNEASALGAEAQLSYNFARDFPLQNPFLTKYFHVYRASVRRLLQTFERRNGIRLWCSVRRSGKTTACFDLESTTGVSTVVSQTCERTAQDQGADLFYQRFSELLGAGRSLPATFVHDTIVDCVAAGTSDSQRFIFLLDEYETLFERMRLAAKRDRELRYTVVQPLLNQLVAFARDNLVVLIGQRPDAHYILMDQNQLSPYVQQDPFPLFEYEGEAGGEFRELVRKVLTERVTFDPAFLKAVFDETAGHPYLTVNLLVSMVDWLISTRRRADALDLTEEDYRAFAGARLTAAVVSVSPEYVLFRQIVGQALAEPEENPWLHAVYTCLRHFGDARAASMLMTRDEFDAFVSAVITPRHGYNAEQLLTTAGCANFLRFDESSVRPQINLLARIAAVSRAGRS